MKRRLILHLGLWKTGTTTIQTFLRGNPDALAAAGVCYPRSLPDDADHPFFRSAPLSAWIEKDINHQALGQEIVGRKRDIVDTPLWSIVFERIDNSGANTAVISYEDFSARTESYRFDAVATKLRAFDVTGLIYLRHPEDWAVSLYAHMVRAARVAVPFGAFIETLEPRLSYSRLLDTIKDHIPLDRLVVGNFDEAAATGLLEDFFSKAGLPRDPLTSAASQPAANRSLPPWAVLFLLRCGQAGLPGAEFAAVRKALSLTLASKRLPTLRPGLDVAAPRERRMLRETADADADRLLARYGMALGSPSRAAPAYRPFDDDDFTMIRDAITPHLPQSTREALAKIPFSHGEKEGPTPLGMGGSGGTLLAI